VAEFLAPCPHGHGKSYPRSAAFPAPMTDSEDPHRPTAHSRQLTSRTTVALPFPPTVDGFLTL
jgi:hypothetical protein